MFDRTQTEKNLIIKKLKMNQIHSFRSKNIGSQKPS